MEGGGCVLLRVPGTFDPVHGASRLLRWHSERSWVTVVLQPLVLVPPDLHGVWSVLDDDQGARAHTTHGLSRAAVSDLSDRLSLVTGSHVLDFLD